MVSYINKYANNNIYTSWCVLMVQQTVSITIIHL